MLGVRLRQEDPSWYTEIGSSFIPILLANGPAC